MRLIDADKLKQYIDDCECCEKCDKKGFMCNEYCELPDCVTPQWERVLNEQPTVDAEPIIETTLVVRKMDSIEELKCDKCRMVWLWSGDLFIFNYCPYCGARVVGKRYKKERKEE